MPFSPVRVESYAGHRSDESPRSVEIGGRMRPVVVVERWRTPEARWFVVRTEEGALHRLHHEEEADLWWIEV